MFEYEATFVKIKPTNAMPVKISTFKKNKFQVILSVVSTFFVRDIVILVEHCDILRQQSIIN